MGELMGDSDTESLNGRLLFAIPKKGEPLKVPERAVIAERCIIGRLHDTCIELLTGKGYTP